MSSESAGDFYRNLFLATDPDVAAPAARSARERLESVYGCREQPEPPPLTVAELKAIGIIAGVLTEQIDGHPLPQDRPSDQ
jgi:hypothetical protein